MSPMNNRLMRPRASGGTGPTSVSGLHFWVTGADYNASTGVWTDKSPNGRNFTQSTGNTRPTKTTTVNGLDVVTFNGASQYITGPAASFNAQQWSAFAVVRPTSVSGVRGIVTADLGGGTRGPQFLRWSGTAYQTIGFPPSPVTIESTSIAAAIGTARIVAAVQSASQLEMWVDGVSDGASSGGQQSYSAATVAIGSATFDPTIGVSGYLASDVGEVLLYDRALTASERQKIEAYLAGRWGITL